MHLLALLVCLRQDPAALIEQLGDSDPTVREEATFRLLEMGDKAVEPLTKALAKAEGEGRTRIQAYHENGYHGWIWHRPYFDCAKAVALADRLEKEHPSYAEEAAWTRLYCHRVRALPKNRASGYKFSGELAQIEWKADGAKVRAIGEEILKRFPEGKYAKRVAELLKKNDPTFEPDRAGEEMFGR